MKGKKYMREVIWAPWRSKLFLTKPKGCLFCKKIKSRDDKKNYILLRGKFSFVMLNAFPYNNGHLMVVPNRHIKDLEQLDSNESFEIFELIKASISALKSALSPHGFNIGINVGKVAGAGVEAHLHVHIVPRWEGDTNFIPVFSGTKVISESLSATFDKLRKEFEHELRNL